MIRETARADSYSAFDARSMENFSILLKPLDAVTTDVDWRRAGEGRFVDFRRDGGPCAEVPDVVAEGVAAVAAVGHDPERHAGQAGGRVSAYVKNQGMGFEVPYQLGTQQRRYRSDSILRIDDGGEDPLNLLVEVKDYRGEDPIEKANTMNSYWAPGVNNLGIHGRSAFAEFTAVFEMERLFSELLDGFAAISTAKAA